jgi:hypothetical protein
MKRSFSCKFRGKYDSATLPYQVATSVDSLDPQKKSETGASYSRSATPRSTSPNCPRQNTMPPEWQAAMQALLLVAEHDGPEMFARIGVMRALHRHQAKPAPTPRRKRAKVYRIVPVTNRQLRTADPARPIRQRIGRSRRGANVRCWVYNGRHLLAASISGLDP